MSIWLNKLVKEVKTGDYWIDTGGITRYINKHSEEQFTTRAVGRHLTSKGIPKKLVRQGSTTITIYKVNLPLDAIPPPPPGSPELPIKENSTLFANTSFQHVVYLIGVLDGSTASVKIGYSSNLPNRLKDLQVGNPLELTILASITAPSRHHSVKVEGRLHKVFKEVCERGEWFTGVTAQMFIAAGTVGLSQYQVNINPDLIPPF